MVNSSALVSVGVRVRPLVKGAANPQHVSEFQQKKACAVLSDTTLRVSDGCSVGNGRTVHFAYDCVFDEDATQEEVYEALALSAVENVVSGTNSSLLTYGQTGSGKTYTILGVTNPEAANGELITSESGVLLRSLQDILNYASLRRNSSHTVVGISALEIYLEEVRDLLSAGESPAVVQMAVTKDHVLFSNLEYVPILELDDALRVYQEASAKRMQRMTFGNDKSSRSHAIFNIEVYQQPITTVSTKPLTLPQCLALKEASQVCPPGTRPISHTHALFADASNDLLGDANAPVMYSKLSLVDLAGSEKPGNVKVNSIGFDELKKINSSLTALGSVVHALYEGAAHIPYRNTKLTTVLRDTFAAPNSHVVLIVTVSPTVLTFDETVSSLHFANKVKELKVSSTAIRNTNNDLDSPKAGSFHSSVRCFAELSADLAIAREKHSFSPPEVIKHVAADRNNLLYDTAFNIRLRDSDARYIGMFTLCDALKAVASEKETANEEERQEELRRELCDEMVEEWKNGYMELHSRLETASADDGPLTTDEWQAWERRLVKEATDYRDTRSMRRQLHQRCKLVATDIEKTDNVITGLEYSEAHLNGGHNGGAYNDYSGEESTHWELGGEWDDEEGEDELSEISSDVGEAAELATTCLTMCNLMYRNKQLSTLLEEEQDRYQSQNEEVLEMWRLSMARAVTDSATTHFNEGGGRNYREVLRSVLGPWTPKGKELAAQPFPYWMRVDADIGANTRSRKKEKGVHQTKYDDPEFLDDVASFMKMGGKVRKFNSDGTCHSRLIYVDVKSREPRLCWSVVGSLGKEGSFPLCLITSILLGRVKEDSVGGVCYTSWGVIHTQHEKDSYGREERVDFVCDSPPEFEAWVIGLSHVTGLWPRFELPMGISDDGMAFRIGDRGVNFCREWHVPLAVYAETREQLLSRQRSKGVRLTPGELRVLVRLDIFRSSAMWLHFRDEGLVVNPLPVLNCYVGAAEGTNSVPQTSTTAATTPSRTSTRHLSLRSASTLGPY
ncbi:kinesin, putative [Trypanosoma equiperdum]|uniref:Kinesin, putative n=2 Tax=Trypanozoon TaxID=39700 RepID=Q57UW8_TRYB2|nr:kinesin, putative [Trypanosoma brucei brucei TREU927]AAX70596.1 kinesin, putative [Trypanosoma brucei]AAZ13248.1 kinesin, putative [Trypanosoma brucei brucei TREU927]SCU69043.1 kinesin, putative [Trypanosoma equiperdum]